MGRFEPVDYGCGVFPLVEVVFFRDCAVDTVEDVFADFAYLGLSGVDESAGRFVCVCRSVCFLPHIVRSTSMY